MDVGVTFPQTDVGTDAEGIRNYAPTVEDLGFDHLVAYDHVLGVEPPSPDWEGSYDYTDQFLEPLTLFSHVGAVTDDIGLVSGVLVLPQRETPLVAKQAATVDVLTEGRLTLGVGVGWNDLEYGNLGYDFSTRGARIEEQIEVLRELWTDELATYDGRWHDLEDAGINPLPDQRPIPVWIGGGADVVLRRIARMGDGWVAPGYEPDVLEETLETLAGYLDEEGRSIEGFPIHVRISLADIDRSEWVDRVRAFSELGATHLAVGTMGMGLETPDEHLEAIEAFADAVGDADVEWLDG